MQKIIRKYELDKLLVLKDKNLIKVVTGVRRAGKSTLLLPNICVPAVFPKPQDLPHPAKILHLNICKSFFKTFMKMTFANGIQSTTKIHTKR
jgi:predicted AAA+ superfamily ATPase